MEDIKLNNISEILQHQFEIKGEDNEVYHLNIKNKNDKFIFECQRNNIIYKKKLRLLDFQHANPYYLSFDDPAFFFLYHLCKLNKQEITIKTDENTIIINIIIKIKNNQTKKEIKLEQEIEIEENKENKAEEELKIFKISLINQYPIECSQQSQKQFIIDFIIKKNYELYSGNVSKNIIEEIYNSISDKESLMEIVIILYEHLLEFINVFNVNLIEYKNELISLYEYISDLFQNKKDKNSKSNICYLFSYGKIFEINEDTAIILNENEKIIIVKDEENIFKKEDENKFIFLTFLQLLNFNETQIQYKTMKTSKIHYEQINKEINNKILIKLNILDYKNKNIFHKIMVNCSNQIIKDINEKIIYFSYNEPKYSQEYFPQKIELFSNNINYKFVLLIIKGYCNEINVLLNEYGGYSYEYYYISKKSENLPNEIIIKLNEKQNYKFNNLWAYETTKRKKITFLNIPKQEGIENSITDKNSFLKIYKCDKLNKVEYGTFLIENIKLKEIQKVEINKSFMTFSINLIKDVKEFMVNTGKMFFLSNKYLNKHNIEFDNELKNDYRLFYFPDDENLFDYFNRLCIWNILLRVKMNYWKQLLTKYFELFGQIKNANLNYTEKIILLITLVRLALENDIKIFAEIKFFKKEDINTDAYTKAYYFHLDLIESLTEESKLMNPFLQLNSYIMDKILTEKEQNIIQSQKIFNIRASNISEDKKSKEIEKILNEKIIIKSAYTISMLPVNIIKSHLKKTMIPYALVYGLHSKRDFFACIKKDNNIICFNEEVIVGDINYMNNDYFSKKFYKPDNIDDYAFIISLLFIHENSSHNKEKITNIKIDSPIIYLDENYNSNFIIINNNTEEGEDDYFVERFIGSSEIMTRLMKVENKLGKLLKIEYFNQDSFDDLIGEFNLIVGNIPGDSILASYVPLEDNKSSQKNNLKIRSLKIEEKYGYLMDQAKKNFSDY